MPEFPQTGLIAKGTGLPDFQLGVQSVTGSVQVGSLQFISRIGSIRRIGSLGAVSRIGSLPRIGSLGRLGSVRAVGSVSHLGSVGYLSRLGTIQRVVSVGTIRNVIAGQDIITGVDIQARLRSGTAIRDRIPLGQGSAWVGSWQDIANYRKKTYVFQPIGTPGSFAAIVGMMGTGVGGGTGTLHLRRIGRGSYGTYDFDSAFRYTRPWFRRGGGGRGTVTVMLARQT